MLMHKRSMKKMVIAGGMCMESVKGELPVQRMVENMNRPVSIHPTNIFQNPQTQFPQTTTNPFSPIVIPTQNAPVIPNYLQIQSPNSQRSILGDISSRHLNERGSSMSNFSQRSVLTRRPNSSKTTEINQINQMHQHLYRGLQLTSMAFTGMSGMAMGMQSPNNQTHNQANLTNVTRHPTSIMRRPAVERPQRENKNTIAVDSWTQIYRLLNKIKELIGTRYGVFEKLGEILET